MLQISTGKFFDIKETFDTTHRGVLYTNYLMLGDDRISTPAGTMRSAVRWRDIETVVCEVVERQPKVYAPGAVVSVAADSFINDFAAVSSFSLQRLFTPDRELAMRLLTAQKPPLGIPKLPKQYVSKVFEMSPPYDAQAPEKLSMFVSSLLKLERKSYLGAIRAIRRYVTAMHRLADDLDLAYALLVAAIESLAQEFDNFSPNWGDYDQNKRRPVDKALHNASPEIATAVRNAILSSEHVAVGRRFREFALSHLTPNFFRHEAAGRLAPAGRSDIELGLRKAYDIRSGYVHTLRSIPGMLAHPISLGDLMPIDGVPHLTFEGLARVARAVILEFIKRAPTSEHEQYEYWNDFPNMLRARLASSEWLHQAEHYTQENAYDYLNGFLEQVEQNLLNPAQKFTDIRAVTAKIETLLPGLAKPEQRRPLTALHFWFSYFLPDEEREQSRQRIRKYIIELNSESAEAFFLHVFGNQLPPWPVEACEGIFETYLRKRYDRKRLNAGIVLGAAGALTIAEMYRLAGDDDDARRMVAQAVEEFPGFHRLHEYEANLESTLQPILWEQILFPAHAESQPPANANAQVKLAKLNRRLKEAGRIKRRRTVS